MQIINLSAHQSVRLAANTPWITSSNPKTGREIKVADLQGLTVEEFVAKYEVATYPANTTGINPQVSKTDAAINVVDHDGITVTHNCGGTTTVSGLPEPQADTLYLTSYVTAQAAARPDVVSPDTIADPATGFAIGAIGYIAFG